MQQQFQAAEMAAAQFGTAFGWGAAAGVAVRLHGIGKVSADLQLYLRRVADATDGDAV